MTTKQVAIIAALWVASASIAQPVDPAASAPVASAAPNALPGPVRRPPALKPPPPLGTDPSTQPGLGQPVTPQLRIPFGRKPPPAIAGSGPHPTGNAASSPVVGDAAARCEAMRAEQARLKCLDELAREANRRN
jgi:hypothetical protein